uniref:MAK10-like protein n=1 Tax=Tanacetum cinerariifolium TaxID=118510 RepID=A0A6L2MCK6_TANCI|nr:MAK10-like protein [Tanacetum cinerariifolium]
MGDANPIRTLRDYSKPRHEGYRNTIELLVGNNVVPLRSDTIRNAKESWALLEDLALYDNESWNDLRDFAKPVKAMSLLQDVPSTFDRRLIKLENQVQRLMEAHLAPTQPTQVNKVTSSCEICSGPTTLSTAWKILNKPLLNMHPRVPTKGSKAEEEERENRKYELMTFTDGIKGITFKTPYKDPERSELSSEGHDLLSSMIIISEDDYDRGCRKPSDLEDGFYRDTIKLRPDYVTGMNDEGEVT